MEVGSKEFFDHVRILIREPKKRHYCYEYSVKQADNLSIHFYGRKPNELLKEYRPHEQEDIYKYRLSIWKPITKSLGDKVINTVNKILNPRYFNIDYGKFPFRAFEDESLEKYFNNYPVYGTIWQWLKETYLRADFADPNAVICILPKYWDIEENETFKPIPYIYKSEDVLDQMENNYYLIYQEKEKNKGYLIYVDTEFYYKWYIDAQEIKLLREFEHGFGIVPAFLAGGMVKNVKNKHYYESFVGGVVPHWNKVCEMTSDKDGSIVNHLYPERWEFQVKCSNIDCKGGYVYIHDDEIGPSLPKGNQEPKRVKCGTCNGTGKITARGPYGAYTVSLDALSEAAVPTPPVEYITKDIEPLNALTTEIESEKKAGFNSINLEILNQVGENQSGIAKVIDRQDMDAFLLRISTHIFDYVLPNVFEITAYWMYSFQEDTARIDEYLDQIKFSKPVEFNVLTIDNLIEEYNKAKEVKANANYLKRIEKEIINIKFARNEQERLKNIAIVDLRPFPNKTDDDLLTLKSMNAIRERDLILNNYLEMLIDMALIDNENFLQLDKKNQLETLYDIINSEFMENSPQITPPEPVEEDGEEREEQD